MTTAFHWDLEPTLAEQVLHLAQQQGRSPNAIVTEAIVLYLQNQPAPFSDPQKSDSLSLKQRRAFMKLPLQERRRILHQQADAIADHYNQSNEWRELQTGDLIEY